jgi:GNAT superfamily N-acetyltransferase
MEAKAASFSYLTFSYSESICSETSFPSHRIQKHEIKACLYDDEENEMIFEDTTLEDNSSYSIDNGEKIVGHAEIHKFVPELTNYHMMDSYDQHSQSLYEFYQEITSNKNKMVCDYIPLSESPHSCNITIIERLEIIDKFQNIGIGKKYIEDLIEFIKATERYPVIILKAFPLEFEHKHDEEYNDNKYQFAREKKRLIKFYRLFRKKASSFRWRMNFA